MKNRKAVAYVITAAGRLRLGEPQITVTERPNDDSTAKVLDQYQLGAYANLGDALMRLASEGWRTLGDPELLETGHYLVDVEKL